MSSADKHKHLDLISQIIARMAQNSFSVRSWCVTVTSAVITLSVAEDSSLLALAALVPIIIFWVIDAYYLAQERQFRVLYDRVRQMDEADIDFAMHYNELPRNTISKAMVSTIYWLLYGGLSTAVGLIALLLFLLESETNLEASLTSCLSAPSSSSSSVLITNPATS